MRMRSVALGVAVVLLAACSQQSEPTPTPGSKPPPTPAPTPTPTPMVNAAEPATAPEPPRAPAGDVSVEVMLEELQTKQEELSRRYGLGKGGRWDVSQDTGLLVFSDDAGVVRQRCVIQMLGSWSGRSKTWMWSWANPSIDDKCKDRLGPVKQFGLDKKLPHWDERVFEATEEDAWEFTAIATHILGAPGAYRGPGGSGATFMVILSIEEVGEGGKAGK